MNKLHVNSDKIKTLKAIFPAEMFIITGSTALALYGLMSTDQVKDLDIILVNPTEEAQQAMQRFMKEFPSKSTAKLTATTNVKASFIYETVKVDIFIEKTHDSELLVLPDGIFLATIPHIVAKKKEMSRIKDWLQLRTMSRVIYTPKEFTKTINTTPLDVLLHNGLS